MNTNTQTDETNTNDNKKSNSLYKASIIASVVLFITNIVFVYKQLNTEYSGYAAHTEVKYPFYIPWFPVLSLVVVSVILIISYIKDSDDDCDNSIKFQNMSKTILKYAILFFVTLLLIFISKCEGDYKCNIYSNYAYNGSSFVHYSVEEEYESGIMSDEEYEQYRRQLPRSRFYTFKKFVSVYCSPLIMIIILGILFPYYMYPWKIAQNNKHKQQNAIGIITYLFGTTVIIWIGMLVWANSETEKNSNSSSYVNSTTDKIKELNSMKEAGLISDEEFEAKRKELIDKM